MTLETGHSTPPPWLLWPQNGPRYRSCHLKGQKSLRPLEKSRFCAQGPFRILEMAHLVIFKGWFHKIPPHLQNRYGTLIVIRVQYREMVILIVICTNFCPIWRLRIIEEKLLAVSSFIKLKWDIKSGCEKNTINFSISQPHRKNYM